MEPSHNSMARKVAQTAINFQRQRTGRSPHSVTVVLAGDTIVVTLHGVLSAAEKALSLTAEGAARVQEFHRQLFADSSEPLRQDITKITGVEVRQATAEVEANTGTIVHVFTTGTMVQVFLLADRVVDGTYSGTGEMAFPLTNESTQC